MFFFCFAQKAGFSHGGEQEICLFRPACVALSGWFEVPEQVDSADAVNFEQLALVHFDGPG